MTTVTTTDLFYSKVFSVLGGMQSLGPFNAVIMSLPACYHYIWPGASFTYMLGAQYALSCIICIIFLSHGQKVLMAPFTVTITAILNILFAIAFSSKIFFLAGSTPVPAYFGLLFAFAGVACGLSNLTSYAIAANLPVNCVGYVSVGNGLSGWINFMIYLFLSEYIFPRTLFGQQLLVTCFVLGIAVLQSTLQLLAFRRIYRRPWYRDTVMRVAAAKKCKAAAEKTALFESNDGNNSYSCDLEKQQVEQSGGSSTSTSSESVLSVLSVIRLSLVDSSNACLAVLLTLLVYPIVGPVGWGLGYTWTTLLLGTHLTMSLIGRVVTTHFAGPLVYAPPSWLLTALVIGRALFIPLFKQAQNWKHSGVVPVHHVLLMVAFAFSNGWLLTAASIRSAAKFTGSRERQVASNFMVLLILLSCMVGSSASAIFK